MKLNINLVILILALTAFVCKSSAQADGYLKPFSKKGKWGYKIGLTDKVIIPAQFDYAGEFSDKGYFAIVGQDCNIKNTHCLKYGLMNTQGQVITGFNYDSIYTCNSKLSYDEIVSSTKEQRAALGDLFFKTSRNGKYGVINGVSGKELLSPIADNVFDFILYNKLFVGYNNLVIYAINGKYGAIDATGKTLLPPEYDAITGVIEQSRNSYSSIDYVIIRKEGKEGILFCDGTIIPAKYDRIYGYDIYRFTANNYSLLDSMRFNLLRWIVTFNNNAYGLYDRKGNELIACELEKPLPYPDEFFIRVKDDYYGATDFYGNEVIPYKYDYIIPYYKNVTKCPCSFYAVKKNGYYGAIAENGKKLLDEEYDTLYYGQDKNYLFYKTANRSYVSISDTCVINFSPNLSKYNAYLKEQKKIQQALLEYEERRKNLGSSKIDNTNNHSKACTCCDGSGKNKYVGTAVYETCFQCKGEGYFGYHYSSPNTGGDKSRWYGGPGYSKSICTVCKGSGKSYARTEKKDCNCCNGTGVNK
jgi:hypothetical protein